MVGIENNLFLCNNYLKNWWLYWKWPEMVQEEGKSLEHYTCALYFPDFKTYHPHIKTYSEQE